MAAAVESSWLLKAPGAHLATVATPVSGASSHSDMSDAGCGHVKWLVCGGWHSQVNHRLVLCLPGGHEGLGATQLH